MSYIWDGQYLNSLPWKWTRNTRENRKEKWQLVRWILTNRRIFCRAWFAYQLLRDVFMGPLLGLLKHSKPIANQFLFLSWLSLPTIISHLKIFPTFFSFSLLFYLFLLCLVVCSGVFCNLNWFRYWIERQRKVWLKSFSLYR